MARDTNAKSLVNSPVAGAAVSAALEILKGEIQRNAKDPRLAGAVVAALAVHILHEMDCFCDLDRSRSDEILKDLLRDLHRG
jgi:hypothetical protein